MSGRKLMGALSIVLLAILFISIGCGDGKRNSKENFRKMNGGSPAGGNPKDLAKASQKLTGIETTMKGHADDGQLIGQQDIEAGTYSLVEVMGYVRYMRNQDEVAAIAIGSVNGGSIADGTNDSHGLMGADSDEIRTVDIPLAFKAQGGALAPQDSNRLYSLQLATSGTTSKIAHNLNGSGTSEIGLLKGISTAPSQTGTHTLQLAGGKTAEIHIRKISGGIRITVTVQEMKMSKVGKKNATLIKRMSFTYKNAQASAQPQPTQPQGPQQPAAPAGPATPAQQQPAAPATNTSTLPVVPPANPSEMIAPPAAPAAPEQTAPVADPNASEFNIQ